MIESAAPSQTRSPQRLWFRRIAVAAVILVPLAFAGLVVGAVNGTDQPTEQVPAALVNEDKLIYQTEEDGTSSPIFAGRQLVTELTADQGFDWRITNADDADRALAAGEVHAILTIPRDFTRSILSLSGDQPRQAELEIRTDDAHSYLTGELSEVVGSSVATAFGKQVTAQYIAGVYEGIASLGGGLTELSDGAASARDGAETLADGVKDYTAGVESLSTGLTQLSDGANRLGDLSSGIGTYTGQISQLARALSGASATLNAEMAANPASTATRTAAATVAAISAQLNAAAGGGTQLAQEASSGITRVRDGISQSAAGAAELADGSDDVRTGASSLASGLDELAAGAQAASAGLGGAPADDSQAAAGVDGGAGQAPAIGSSAGASAAEVAAEPVVVNVTRDNGIADAGQATAAFIVPLGLWMGALAVFLIMRPIPARMLASTARTGRLLGSALGRASAITAAQSLILVALLHLGVGVSWALLPATTAFALLAAVTFTAFHHFLIAWLGRAGLVVSLLAVAVQITSSGGLYPIEMLAQPYQLASPLLPLTYAVAGMQGILAGGSVVPVIGAALALVGFGAASVLLSTVALRRARQAAAPWPLPAT